MEFIVVSLLVAALPLAGAYAAVAKATAPEAPTARRVELSILAGLLLLVALFIALVGYWMWDFTENFTF
ncbi:MAG: hypothetical protein ACR2HM_09680 [Acidimicrobiales bacterium]